MHMSIGNCDSTMFLQPILVFKSLLHRNKIDPTSMENKKGAFQNQNITNSTPPAEIPNNEAIPKHAHQHNNAPQHLRFLQYGLKIPNHQHPQVTPSHTHQQLNSPLHMHVHQHNPQYQTTHRHLQPSPQFNSMGIHQNTQFPPQNLKYVHQHQKPSNLHQNQPLYQATQPPPSSVHAHNQMAQNTPQIWVPHQPPLIHYHQQQTQKAEAQKPHTPTAPQTQSKPKEIERKKSSGGSSQLRSPSAKRPLEAPVTMQGWLHKQGSEGLMLWKKRWFVLSEYCLFYYKGLEEEKLLGSILLPSYKVSICRPEDKVNRKYAFKCEHANMRTYILAADSQELMMQWVRVLNLACMLQTNTENEKPAVTETPTQNKPAENPEPQKQNLRSTPIHTHSSSSTTDLSNPSQMERNQFNQPLYANAPPKPRRLNDGFSSPSPDVLDRYPNPQYVETQHANRSLAKSPISIYGQQVANPQMPQPEYYSHSRPKDNSREYMFTPTGEIHNTIQNAERRTPDTYGRSKLHPAKFRHPTDYEDVYNDQSMYKRPLSPIAYTHVVKKNNPPLNPAYRAYTPVNMLGPADIVQYAPPQMRKSPSCIARPHSADFLEYEINHRQPNAAILSRQQPRPKSSLDINRNLNDSDNYFYSEERYAEKMRKSAQYLHKMPPRFANPPEPSHQKSGPVMRYPESDNTFPLMRSSTQPINFNTLHIREPPPEPQPVRSRSVLSEGSLSKEIDMDFCGSSRNITERGSISPGYSVRDMYNYNNNIKNREYDQFTRSASARLAQTTPQNERPQDKRHMTREGERKREESMRRLLEWKQRMLQSPLNRKSQGNRAYPGRCDNYHINPENGYPMHLKHGEPHLDDRRSITNLPQYNSYSSDDEENEDRSKESVHSQAGRTLDTFPNNSESPTPAHTTSTTVFNTFKEPDKPLMHSDLMHDTPYTNIFQLPEDEPCKDSEDSTFTKPLKQFNKESSNLAHVSSLKSEYFDKFEQSPIVTEIKSNGALVKSILAEFETKTETSNNDNPEEKSVSEVDIDSVIEENYMTMTPKKSVLGPRSSTNSDATVIFNDLEADENHYVEMTQNADASLLGSALTNSDFIEQQPYEMVCFNEGRLEPVYMELKTPDQKANNKDCQDLPDILMASKRKKSSATKSDSSDADDEASKDLDSLDTPNQPRFSLSDTFRPASYYLGVSRTVPEFQDSSDSELVSPPPIPSSPPPLDDLDNIEDFNFATQDKSKKDESYRFNLLARLQVNRNSDQFFNSANKNSKCVNKFGKGSTQSLDVKKESFFSSNNKSDVSSICSVNIDTERRYDSRLSHNSDSDVEIRVTRLADYENMLKRRPVSEEFCNELESLDGTYNNDNLNDLQVSNTSLASNEESISHIEYHDYENFFVSSYPKVKSITPIVKIPRPAMASPSALQSAIKETSDKQANDEFVQIGRSESSASTSAEISSLLHNSNCSTPVVDQDVISTSSLYMSDRRDKSANSSFSQSAAPYYYSDLSVNTTNTESGSMLTLNNQRGAMNGSKRDITHIINPIKCNSHIRNSSNTIESDIEKDTFKLAAEARSVSVDFLNLTDKSGSIDKKNIYESDTLKRQKISDSVTPETRNLYPMRKSDKFNTEDDTAVRRSHSLEGLLENVLSETVDSDVVTENELGNLENQQISSEGSYLWEEDSIWRERLRSASQRHTKSMEDLDSIGEVKKKQKKAPRGISRGVTYVNDNFFKQDKHQKEQENKETKSSKNEIKKEGSFIIDREKLRQWDLLSSAPSDDQLSTTTAVQAQEGSNLVVELGEGNCDPTENSNTQEAASGSISINPRDVSQLNMRDTFPRTISAKKVWSPNQPPMESRSVTNLSRANEMEQFGPNPQGYFPGQHELPPEAAHQINTRKENWSVNDKMNVSAGELLGRTHEELVLLLIQLRRQSAQTVQAIENCYNEIDTIQAQLHMMDQARRMENLQKLEQIKQHLLELEKQYEKGKPLVNLVDNMVKLGSLYRVPTDRSNLTPYIRDRLEFNQQIQERRLLAEEKREWNRLNPNHFHLQEKVQQLYQLDRLIHEESGTLQNLQQDKEDIERALGGLRHRLTKGFNDPAEIEQARKQQIMLENELSRVHLMLAQNSKKLEETVAGNARLEQELLVLKQKLQTSRQQRSSQQFSNAGDSLTCAVGNSAMLESDLHRVQKKIGDLQKQRQELSIQVRQLTDRSNNIPQQKSSPSSVQSSQCKKKITSLWRETDLDTMNIVDHGESWDNSTSTNASTPLYINTDMKLGDTDFYNRSTRSSDSTSDNTSLNSNLPQEKQEIKTVRIVKRESERRQRDREKTTTGKWDTVMEEDDSSQNSSILFRPTPVQKIQSATNLASPNYEESKTDLLSRQNSISSPNLPQCSDGRTTSSTDVSTDKSPELSPVFKSEAARQIITEMSIHDTPKQSNRRMIPKEKRRHYTAPHNNLIMKSLHQLPTDNNAFNKMIMNSRRARDDMDMERALRQRIDAPDVVRSTLSSKELKYNESTIDNILGTPNKISIPERYIPEQLPQLSAEEQEYRLRKVESIKKMLSDTALISSSSANLNSTEDKQADSTTNSITNKATTKMIEEKKQREHLLHLNQILAKQVMEMSKIVAVKALAKLPLQLHQVSTEEEDSSPLTPLPIYQQRDNFYS